VDAVVPESPAARAGFRRGDLILLIGDAVITSVTDVQQRMAEFRPGQKMTFTVDRDQQLQPLELTAGQGGTGGGNKP
jgi:S1-C subfamily serine protease